MRYIQDPKTLELVPADEYVAPSPELHHVMPDIAGYRSMVDGSWIGSRSTHREHLKAHNCIEIGNETKYLKPKELTPAPGLRDALARATYERLRRR